MDTQPLPSEPSLDNGPHSELIRDVWHLDDQLLEALEALQMETARREGMAPKHRLPQDNLRVPGGGSEADMDDGEVGLRDIPSLHSCMQVPLRLMQMSDASSACSWLG